MIFFSLCIVFLNKLLTVDKFIHILSYPKKDLREISLKSLLLHSYFYFWSIHIVQWIEFFEIHLQVLSKHLQVFICYRYIAMSEDCFQTHDVTVIKNPEPSKRVPERMNWSDIDITLHIVTIY